MQDKVEESVQKVQMRMEKSLAITDGQFSIDHGIDLFEKEQEACCELR